MPDKEQLRQMQSLPLNAKVLMTKGRIRDWYNYFGGAVVISFSGGKDSTVLAHLVHSVYPDVPLVFSDTGLEYPEIRAFCRKMGAEFVRPKMRFDEVISKYGYPIIGKEISEAIYYARRIRNGGGTVQQTRNEPNYVPGDRPQTAELMRGGVQRDTAQAQRIIRNTGNQTGVVNRDSVRRNLLTGGTGNLHIKQLSVNETSFKDCHTSSQKDGKTGEETASPG